MSESPYIYDVTAETFQQIIIEGSHQVPILVDFWADWCQPCKMLMPVLAKLADEYQGKFILAKINTEQQQALAAQFGIRSIPTVKLFKNGEPVDEFAGALPETELRAFLDKHLPRASDHLLNQAGTLIQQGNVEAAKDLLEQAQNEDPDNPRLPLMQIELLAQSGDITGAEAAIQQLPYEEQQKPEITALQARFTFAQALQGADSIDDLQSRAASSSEAAYQLAAHKVMADEYEEALQMLLDLMRRDRQYGDDAARKGILAIFELLGGENPLVGQYRNKLFNLLH